MKLAIKLKLDGAYIPSFNKDLFHLNYRYPKNFTIIGSAHNLREIRIKEKQGVKLIVISSLFKKKKNFLNIYKFRLLTKLTKKKVIALGGISQKNLKLLNLSECIGFAGITYFEQKKGP